MRPGIVVTLRVNPKDCMSVVDVINATGMNIAGQSFPSMVSLTLSSLLQAAREGGLIPERTGFEYSEMMAPYKGSRRNKRKLEITDSIHRAGHGISIPALSAVHEDATPSPSASEAVEATLPLSTEVVDGEVRMARMRLAELVSKKDLAESGAPGVMWSDGDEIEFQSLYRIVYPEG